MWDIIITNISYTIIFLIIVLIFLINKKPIKKTTSKALAPFGYTLFYTDQNMNFIKRKVIYKKLLYSKKYNIQGKPDYIFKRFKTCYIIELKSGNIKNSPMPHMGDLMQLVAYFLIVKDLYGYKVKKGKLIYNDYTFIIRNTRYLRKKFLNILSDMRLMLKTGEGVATCDFVHCRYCMCKNSVCTFYNKNR